MLKIKVNNQEIYITKGTSIQMEVNNPIFFIDEIPGEIIYTFDVPAQQNDQIFNFARFTYVQKTKKYEAEILVGGVQIAKGDLYIQKATKLAYSLGLVCNPFPAGWIDKKLSESDYGEIIISKNETEHRAKWIEFLQNTLVEDSNIKFPLFINENFYGGKNEDFGFHEGKQASLYKDNTQPPLPLEKFYINRLFTKSGNVIQELEGSNGIRIFNKILGKTNNTYCFCPALNLFYFIKLFYEKININIIGNFLTDNKLKRIYYQSLHALDNSVSQYNGDILGVFIKTNKKIIEGSASFPLGNKSTIINYEGKKMQYFKPAEDGIIEFEIVITAVLHNGFFETEHFMAFLGMYIIENKYYDPNSIGGVWLNGILKFYYVKNETSTEIPHIFGNLLSQLDIPGYYEGTGVYQLKYTFTAEFSKNSSYRFYIDKFDLDPTDRFWLTRQNIDLFDVTMLKELSPHNIFSNKLNINNHTPNISNGEFISVLKNTFGLSFYMDSQKKEVELSFIKDIEKSSYLQLDSFLLDDETYITEATENEVTYILPPVIDNEIDDTRLISEVDDIKNLAPAKNNFGKIAFVKNQNKYVESIKKGNEVENWIYLYEKYSGNNKAITTGEGEVLEIKPNVLIPNMKDIDRNIPAPNTPNDIILEIDKTGVSPLFSTGSSDQDLILINCMGLKKLSKPVENQQLQYESAVLVDNDTAKKYDLCVTGENSIGKIFIEPWLKLLADYEPITHKFLFDLKTFLEVLRLLKPQDLPPEQQTRWVFVGSVKLLPIKMTFQFTEGKPYILTEIEFAKPRVKI